MRGKPTISDLLRFINELAPFDLSESWDNVGLQVGREDQEFTDLLVALDLTEEVISAARSRSKVAVVTHHPLIFSPLTAIRTDAYPGSYLHEICSGGISLIVAHTNLDKACGGVSDALADIIGLSDRQALVPAGKHYKLVVFVPEEDSAAVRKAIGDAGSGLIGNYSHCSFEAPGIGRFTPLEGASPAIGKVGVSAEVREMRVEALVPGDRLAAAIQAMLDVHPYEEVAYDVYPLERQDSRVGLGRVGRLVEKLSLAELTSKVEKRLGTRARFVGEPAFTPTIAAVCGGSGGSLIERTSALGADVLITGDIKYHQAMLARELGLSLIDAGHRGTERVILRPLAEKLRDRFAGQGVRVDLIDTGEPWREL